MKLRSIFASRIILGLVLVSAPIHGAEFITVERYLGSADFEKAQTVSENTIKEDLREMAEALGLNDYNRHIYEEFERRLIELYRANANWPAFRIEMANIYATMYTENEMQAIAEFFESPAGKSFEKNQPIIAEKQHELSHKVAERMQPEMDRLIKEFSKQFIEAGSGAHNSTQYAPSGQGPR